MKNKLLKISVALGLALALSACGGPAEPEQTLEERVMARWQHMIERDFEAAWEYYAPGFRQTTPQSDFVRDFERRPIRWHAAEFIDLDCQEDVCQASIRIEYQPVGAPGAQSQMRLDRVVEENWVRIQDDWWFSAG